MPKCRYCKQKFDSKSSLDRFCSVAHAIAWLTTPEGAKAHSKAREKREKAKRALQRKKDLETKARLKTRREWIADLQREFNHYIRLRDHDKPCISCGRHDYQVEDRWRGGKWDAGHYRSVGSAPELRFNEDNCHKQCKQCNNFKSGNHVEYRMRVIKKIGAARLEALEGNHPPLKLTITEIKELLAKYRSKKRELQKRIKNDA